MPPASPTAACLPTFPAAASTVAREVWYLDAATDAVFGGADLYAAGQEGRVLALVVEGQRSGGRVAPGEDPFEGVAPDARRPLLVDGAERIDWSPSPSRPFVPSPQQ